MQRIFEAPGPTCDWGRRIYIRLILLLLLGLLSAESQGQESKPKIPSDSTIQPLVIAELAWLQDIYDHGVKIIGDSVYFNEETRRIATDSVYRNILFPATYSWNVVPIMLDRKAVKPALWYMINLYHQDTSNLNLVLKMILPMEQVIQMDRALVAAYYTYISFDPEVYEMVNGRSVRVKRPDIAEQKLMAVRTLIDYVLAKRNTQNVKTE